MGGIKTLPRPTKISPSETIPEEYLNLGEDLDDGEDFDDILTHIILGGQEAISRSLLTGEPVSTLCGKKTQIKSRSHENPICQKCVEIGLSIGILSTDS